MRIVPAADGRTAAAEAEHFTGTVWRTPMIQARGDDSLTGQRLAYAPGARSHWHSHTAEQVLVALEGHGLVAWEGGPGPRALQAGDWVHVTPDVPHWHGATESSPFVHLAVTSGGHTRWYGPAA